MALERSKTINGLPYYEASVDLANTAAEATSAATTVLLPSYFRPHRPIFCGMKVGEAAMEDNAVLLAVSYSYSKTTDRITASLKFANNNVAAGAAINPAAKIFCFVQF